MINLSPRCMPTIAVTYTIPHTCTCKHMSLSPQINNCTCRSTHTNMRTVASRKLLRSTGTYRECATSPTPPSVIALPLAHKSRFVFTLTAREYLRFQHSKTLAITTSRAGVDLLQSKNVCASAAMLTKSSRGPIIIKFYLLAYLNISLNRSHSRSGKVICL